MARFPGEFIMKLSETFIFCMCQGGWDKFNEVFLCWVEKREKEVYLVINDFYQPFMARSVISVQMYRKKYECMHKPRVLAHVFTFSAYVPLKRVLEVDTFPFP